MLHCYDCTRRHSLLLKADIKLKTGSNRDKVSKITCNIRTNTDDWRTIGLVKDWQHVKLTNTETKDSNVLRTDTKGSNSILIYCYGLRDYLNVE